MLMTKKPADDKKLTFPKMGAKPFKKKKPTADVENAADAKKPGDKKEDAADLKKPAVKPVVVTPPAAKKPVIKKTKNKGKGAAFAQKAALALAAAK